ncbi:4CL [Mytilus coruscus]|uniref:4CL n=1 Tax=Mytilus coruscus TaxID=42192 RepID=A0A6J8B3K1_MYTCO|nr:4CL [Mytilus coruscus]
MACRLIGSLMRSTWKTANRITYHRQLSISSRLQTILGSPHPDLDIRKQSLPEYLFSKLDEHSHRIALVDFESGRSFTYSEVKEYAVRIASALRKLGYKKGDIVAIHATNSLEYAILLLALPAAGITITASNSSFTAEELARNLDLTEAACVVTTPTLLPVVTEALISNFKIQTNIKDIITLGDVSGYKSIKTLMEDDGSAFPEDLQVDCENDIVALPFSSGTTGFPKAVMLNHRCMVANLQQLSYTLTTTPDDSFIAVLPFFHAYGMSVITYYAFAGGNKLVTLPKFDPGLFLQAIQNEKISLLHLVPPMAVFMVKHPMVNDFNLSGVQRAICGAAPLGETVHEEFISRLNINLTQGYGMTEFGPASIIDAIPASIGTVGKPVPNTLCKIVHPGTNNLIKNVGESGEICMKGPQLMKGYLHSSEATNETVKEGWIHTGDIGYIREDGNVVITDRVKDLIKYKALQIAPADLEDVLLKHPDIQDAAVIGIPDERTGEVPRAYVVRKPNCHVEEHQIQKFMKDHVAEFKFLRGGIKFTEAIPKTPSGKILRRTLRQEFLKSS